MIVKTRLPKRIASLLESWQDVYLSPSSNSYYSVPHSDITLTGAMRVSDHWNMGNGTFKTDKPVINGHWTVAKFNGAVWVVLLSLNPRKNARTIDNTNLNLRMQP